MKSYLLTKKYASIKQAVQMQRLFLAALLFGASVACMPSASASADYATYAGYATKQWQGEFREYRIMSRDGVQRPFVVYTPKQAYTDKKRPLIVYLHGAVTTPNVRENPIASAKKNAILALADQKGYSVLFPYGQKAATWFDDVGVQMVLDEVDWAKQNLSIDEKKIFLAGFSDGASGVLYFAHNFADEFAGFLAFNGSLAVAAALGELPIYPENINGKPLYLVNTQSDMLYPSALIRPSIDYLQKHQPQIIFKSPVGNHDMSYFASIQDELTAFIEQNRDTFLPTLSLQVAQAKTGQFDWISIEQVDTTKATKGFHYDYSLLMRNEKASLGIRRDADYQSKGIKVAGFSKNSAAKQMGVQVGDVILAMEDVPMSHPYASYEYLSKKKAGEPTSLTILRGEQTMVLQGKFSEAYDYQVFEKQPASAKIQAQFLGDKLVIHTSKVASFTIDFDQLPLTEAQRQQFMLEIDGQAQSVHAVGRQLFSLPK